MTTTTKEEESTLAFMDPNNTEIGNLQRNLVFYPSSMGNFEFSVDDYKQEFKVSNPKSEIHFNVKFYYIFNMFY